MVPYVVPQMSKIEKLIEKAITTPQNVRFQELCRLCVYFGMKRRKKSGNHRIYKRQDPKFTLSIQEDNGMAKPYQVNQLLNKLREHGLYDFGEED